MATEVRLPQLADAMTAARLSAWLKRVGDPVQAGEPLVEFETDKTNVEVEAPVSGVLHAIQVAAGTDAVPVGAVLAVIGDGAAAAETVLRPAPAPPVETPRVVEPSGPPAAPEATVVTLPVARKESKRERPVKATPLAAKMARLTGLDLADLRPSRPDGRITKADVHAALGQSAPLRPAAARPADLPDLGELPSSHFEDVPLTAMRRATAARLQESKRNVPHFYLHVDCRADALLAFRADVNARLDGLRISVTDLIVVAAALAFRKVPQANAAWTGTGVRRFEDVHIAVAVNTPRGLITPVLRDVQSKPLVAVSRELKALAARARDGALKPEDYKGGTFTISNLGMFGIRGIVPIVNPPQACILGVGSVERQPVVVGDALAVGAVMSCTLAADHRVIDGATGAEWLAELRRLLEDPLALALRP